MNSPQEIVVRVNQKGLRYAVLDVAGIKLHPDHQRNLQLHSASWGDLLLVRHELNQEEQNSDLYFTFVADQ